jgi:hypothetical protein
MANPADKFFKTISDVDSPAEFAFVIPDMHVPDGSSTVEVGRLSAIAGIPGGATTRALYVGVTGNVFCRMANTYNGTGQLETEQANVHFQGIPAGTILPLRIEAIWANNYTDDTSNTTATGLIGLY